MRVSMRLFKAPPAMRLQYGLYNASVIAEGLSADITSFRPFAHNEFIAGVGTRLSRDCHSARYAAGSKLQ